MLSYALLWIQNQQSRITPLLSAALNKEAGLVQLLLTKGADLNIPIVDGSRALHCASELAVVDLLLENGTDINAIDKYRVTALHEAAWCLNKDVVERLFSRGANPILKNRDGMTALQKLEAREIKIGNSVVKAFPIDQIRSNLSRYMTLIS